MAKGHRTPTPPQHPQHHPTLGKCGEAHNWLAKNDLRSNFPNIPNIFYFLEDEKRVEKGGVRGVGRVREEKK
jgi:hypothetical protein